MDHQKESNNQVQLVAHFQPFGSK